MDRNSKLPLLNIYLFHEPEKKLLFKELLFSLYSQTNQNFKLSIFNKLANQDQMNAIDSIIQEYPSDFKDRITSNNLIGPVNYRDVFNVVPLENTHSVIIDDHVLFLPNWMNNVGKQNLEKEQVLLNQFVLRSTSDKFKLTKHLGNTNILFDYMMANISVLIIPNTLLKKFDLDAWNPQRLLDIVDLFEGEEMEILNSDSAEIIYQIFDDEDLNLENVEIGKVRDFINLLLHDNKDIDLKRELAVNLFYLSKIYSDLKKLQMNNSNLQNDIKTITESRLYRILQTFRKLIKIIKD